MHRIEQPSASVLVSCIVVITSMEAYAQEVGASRLARADNPAPVRFLVHEAFAQPLEGAATPSPSAGSLPKAPLHETPAAIKPSVATATWIPGYWAWDSRGNGEFREFMWVPGVWRIPPPGMRWVPGYGNQEGEKWRWVRGFWYPRNQPRLRYLPLPPPPQDEPELSGLADNEFAIPGYWSYAGGRYVWNRGFKARRKAGWVWIPSHYVWTPAGNLFLAGYWDFAVERRGLLLAPSAVASQERGSPPQASKAAVNLAELPRGLVANAEFGHYYFQPRTANGSKATVPLSELARRRDLPQRLTEVDPDSLRRISEGAEGVRLLAVQRSKFESTAEGSRDDAPMAFYLPPPAEPIDIRSPTAVRNEAAGQYVPGVAGRRVPGARDRSLPGMSGRTVPGVDTNIPGVVAPGVVPGTDTRGALPSQTARP